MPKSEIDQTAHQRPSRDFKRPERVNRTFSSATKLNSNTDSNAKSTDAPKEKPKKTSFRPASDYDYYDDGDVRIIGKANSKVPNLIWTNGFLIYSWPPPLISLFTFRTGESNLARGRHHWMSGPGQFSASVIMSEIHFLRQNGNRGRCWLVIHMSERLELWSGWPDLQLVGGTWMQRVNAQNISSKHFKLSFLDEPNWIERCKTKIILN